MENTKTYAYTLDTTYSRDRDSVTNFYLVRKSEGPLPRPTFWDTVVQISGIARNELPAALADAATAAFGVDVSADEIALHDGGPNGKWHRVDAHGGVIDPEAKLNGVELTGNDLWTLGWALDAALKWEPGLAPGESDTEHRINQHLVRELKKKLGTILPF